MFEQTFDIECNGHTFEFTLSRETVAFMHARGYAGKIHGATCPTCGAVRSIDTKELLKERKKAEDEETQAAREDAGAELLAAAGGDKKKVHKHELDALAAKKVDERIKARGKLALKKQHAKENNKTRATWTDSSRGHVDHGGDPPVAPDTTGMIDSTG